nr:hypothetical protein Iba_chr12cCG22270 [Ipomoea batatas]
MDLVVENFLLRKLTDWCAQRMKTGARWLMNMFINIRLVLVAMEKWFFIKAL